MRQSNHSNYLGPGTAGLPAVSNSIRMSPVPAIFGRLGQILAESSRSRLARLIVFLHAAWFLLAIANMSPPSHDFAHFLEHAEASTVAILAGRPFRFHHESLSLQILTLIDLPSSLASTPVAILFLPFFKLFHLGLFEGSYIDAGVLLVVSSLQWLTIGYRAHKWLNSRPWGVVTLQRLNRHFILITVLILLFTAVSVPLLNARSRRLVFRHAAISYHCRLSYSLAPLLPPMLPPCLGSPQLAQSQVPLYHPRVPPTLLQQLFLERRPPCSHPNACPAAEIS